MELVRESNRYVCTNQHSFDTARSGYVNLLQPQDRRSRAPGDTREAVAARRRLHDRGVTRPLFDAIREFSALTQDDAVLDAGCGEGFYLGNLHGEVGCAACGVDISVAAIDLAGRRYPDCQWLVANADRFLPYPDHSFSAVLSITARMNSAEFHRVLRKDGTLLVAIPAPDDLIELRGAGRDRAERTVQTFAPSFILEAQKRVTTTAMLETSAVEDVLLSIYRPLRREPVESQNVTFSLDLLRFRPLPAAERMLP